MENPKQQTNGRNGGEEEEEEEKEEDKLNDDVLESVLSRLHLVHILPARYVSKSWSRAASTSVRRRLSTNKLKPWLIIHTQTTTSPYVISARAYDRASHVWLDIVRNHHHHPISWLRSSHSTLLYMLSPSTFAFSFDALHLEWHHVDAPPRFYGVDPIVAKIGHRVVFASEMAVCVDGPFVAEMYDMKLGAWETCGSLPPVIKGSSALTYLSVAVDERRMYVMKKYTGLTYSFDPETKTWNGPYGLSPQPMVFNYLIGFVNGRLILVVVVGVTDSIKLWEVKICDDYIDHLQLNGMIGEMPEPLLEMLMGRSNFPRSIAMTCMGGLICLYNCEDPSLMILCEIENEKCRWTCIINEAVKRSQTMVVTCTNVGLPELQKAVQVGALKLE